MRLIAPTVRRHGWRLCSLLVWRSETAITVDFNGVCDGISPDGFGWGDVRRKVVLKEGFQGILTGVKEEKPEMEKGKGRGKKKKGERRGLVLQILAWRKKRQDTSLLPGRPDRGRMEMRVYDEREQS